MLQAIKYIPIHEKTIKELCIKKTSKKKRDPPTIQVISQLASLMFAKITIEKYIDPGIAMVTISINYFSILNILIDLGTTINVMTTETMKYLKLTNI